MNNQVHSILAEKSTTMFCGTMEVDRYAKDAFTDHSLWRELAQEMELPPAALDSNGLPYEIDLSPEERRDMQTLFLEGFINSSHPDPAIRHKDVYAYIRQYKICINRPIPLFEPGHPQSMDIHIHVAAIRFFLFSPRLLIFVIEVNNDGRLLKEIALQNKIIRDVEHYAGKQLSIDFVRLYSPLLFLHNRVFPGTIPEGDYSENSRKQYIKLLYRGNKLKLFLTVRLAESYDNLLEGYTLNELLYELGTCSPIGMMTDREDSGYPSDTYYNSLISQNTVSCFANWRALALMDTFCIVMKSNNPDYSYEMWRGDYFEFIYINALFIKSFLIYINDKYKRSDASVALEDEFIAFDKVFNFHTISYNFLPQIVYAKIRKGLEIDEELQVLNEKIHFFGEKLDRINEKRINHILLWLAVIAVFSAVNDALELFSKIAPDALKEGDYSWIGRGLLTFVVVVGICLYLFNSQKKIR